MKETKHSQNCILQITVAVKKPADHNVIKMSRLLQEGEHSRNDRIDQWNREKKLFGDN